MKFVYYSDKIDKLKRYGVVMTKGHQLPAKYVIHVKFAEDIGDWHGRFYKCIEKANGKNLKSIAFPVLGTGNISYKYMYILQNA